MSPVREGVMSAYILILAVEAVVLLAVWRWDERARRAELDRRRHLRLAQKERVEGAGETTRAAAAPSTGPTLAAPGTG